MRKLAAQKLDCLKKEVRHPIVHRPGPCLFDQYTAIWHARFLAHYGPLSMPSIMISVVGFTHSTLQ